MKFSIAIALLLSASSAVAFQAHTPLVPFAARSRLHAVAIDPFTVPAPKATQKREEIDMTGIALSVSVVVFETISNSLFVLSSLGDVHVVTFFADREN
jgi:hypothetical protein